MPQGTLERFMSKVVWNGDVDECWIWEAAKDKDGYGVFWLDGAYPRAHRVSYELFIGPIPDGLFIDHVKARGCRSVACVNPGHLEPVTHLENCWRGELGRHHAQKTHCPHGHLYAGRNLIVESDGSRKCRTCKNERRRPAHALTV